MAVLAKAGPGRNKSKMIKLDDNGLCNPVVRLAVFSPRVHARLVDEAGATETLWTLLPAIPEGTGLRAYIRHIETCQAAGTSVPFLVFRRSDDAFLGVVAFEQISRIHRRVQISNLWQPETDQGPVVFHAVQALLIGRALDWGARRIGWLVPSGAGPIREALDTLGARHEASLRSYMRMADGSWSDMEAYAMLRSDARAALGRLQSDAEAVL